MSSDDRPSPVPIAPFDVAEKTGEAAAPGPGKYDRSQPTDARRSEQRQRLLGAAAQVFARHGYTGASVDLVIREVRMSRRTFYEHFKDLEDTFLAVYETGQRLLEARVEEAVAREEDPVAQVREGIIAYLRAVGGSAALARVLYHEIHAIGPAEHARHEAMRDRFARLWAKGFENGFRKGLAKRIPDDVTIYALSTAVEAVAMRYLDRGEEAKILEAAPALVALALTATQYTDEDILRLQRVADVAPKKPET
ncbi:MAG TPA: TetR/AcrR family transcriptional regulator [Polyangiaceae bacterium]|nr:TetR/AcrR family transcriptional regulator [Polyangiaceae bacterium]